MSATGQQPIDEGKLNAFMAQAVADLGGAFTVTLVRIGEQLGLYKAMAGAGPLTAGEVAERTGTNERCVREWLNAQAAGGYVEYDRSTGRYTLPPEQALALAVEDSPAYLPGAHQVVRSVILDEAKIVEAFRTGNGLGWHEHCGDLFQGTERFFRPNYLAHLIPEWIPALDGVEARLRDGALAADVGCGHGASTIILAQAYPNSQFLGFDYHQPSIERARWAARQAGLGARVVFETAASTKFPGSGYDLVAFFDCLHDMGDPVGAAAHVRASLAPDGVWMIVEPFANDRTEDNLNPVGRVYYSASSLICTLASQAQEGGAALGAQAGEARLRDVVMAGGFTRFRRAAETQFNMVFEARP
jgi:SAM-dependent methyltransferase